ncbi:MAG: Fe-S cluster assembly protein SufD [Chloroflexi bacterium]|nr:Fe-S cluster assembly protein SufD [Chloroflexota bacterium]
MATVRQRRKREFVEPPIHWEQILERAQANNEPQWLITMRQQAWEQYKSMPMPTLRDESWRRTDYSHINWDTAGTVTVADSPEVERIPAANRAPLIGEEQGGLLAWVDNALAYQELNERLEQQGVIFTDLATACHEYPDLVQKHLFTRAVRPEEGKFAALNAAGWTHGLFVYVPKNTLVDLPLHSIFYNEAVGASLGHVLIILDRGAEATILQEYLSPEGEEHSSFVGATELIVGPNANLRYVSLQAWGHNMYEFNHGRGHVDRDGQLDWVVGSMGSKLTKSFMQISLDGQGAWGRMSGMFFADGQQLLDHDTLQIHHSPHTTSDLLFKAALKDEARSVWRGMIRVMPGAQKTDGFQANNNMLMSRTARADSIPGLEIEADDVRCTHAATVGKMEEEYIFYLMTRGVPRIEAERLFINGYFWDVLERIPFEDVQTRLLADVDRKILGLHNVSSGL